MGPIIDNLLWTTRTIRELSRERDALPHTLTGLDKYTMNDLATVQRVHIEGPCGVQDRTLTTELVLLRRCLQDKLEVLGDELALLPKGHSFIRGHHGAVNCVVKGVAHLRPGLLAVWRQ